MKDKAIMGYYEMQDKLLGKNEMTTEQKASMSWGGLLVLYNQGAITWDQVRHMFGEFMSFVMKVR